MSNLDEGITYIDWEWEKVAKINHQVQVIQDLVSIKDTMKSIEKLEKKLGVKQCFGHYDFCEHRPDKRNCKLIKECIHG